MNIQRILEELVIYYSSTRRVGHTKMMLDGALNTGGLVVLAHSPDTKWIGLPKKEIVTLLQIEGYKLRGMRNPIAFDNYALETIFSESLDTIHKLEGKLRELESTKEKLTWRIDALESQLKEYKNEQRQSS